MNLAHPKTRLVLTPHNKPKNKTQRLLDERIESVIGISFRKPDDALNNRLQYLKAVITAFQYPADVKTSRDPDGTPVIIIGDKSQPYYRCIRIEKVSPENI